MKTVIFAAMAAASFTLAAAPALAQEAEPFSGGHAEIITGYDAVKTNSNGLGTPDGLLYGLNLGYDLRLGGAVVGVEGEIADSTASRDVSGGKLDAARDLYIGGRIGAPIGDRTLAYVKAGYTNARVEAPGFGSNGDGYRLGAGLEYNLNNRVFVKGEYRYSNYQDDIERHQVVGGLGVRF